MLEKLEKKDYQVKLSKAKAEEGKLVGVFLEGFIEKFYCDEGDFYILKQDYQDYENGKVQFERSWLRNNSLGGVEYLNEGWVKNIEGGVCEYGNKEEDNREEDNKKEENNKEEKNKIDIQEEKIKKYEDLLRRNQAEFENYKKRTLKNWEDFRLRSSQALVEKLLPIMDNLEKAKEVGEYMGLKDGTLLIEKQMRKVLSEEKVEKIKSEGEDFNPSEHEAVQIEETGKDYKVDTVIKEWQSGYRLGGKVIRTAKVVVAKGGGILSDVREEED